MKIMLWYNKTKEYFGQFKNFLINKQKHLILSFFIVIFCIISFPKSLFLKEDGLVKSWNETNGRKKNKKVEKKHISNNSIYKTTENGKIFTKKKKNIKLHHKKFLKKYDILGARRGSLQPWKNQINYSWNELRAEIKKRQYLNNVQSQENNSFSYFATLLEKVSEQEKNNIINKKINWGHLILGGVKIVEIIKNENSSEKKFKITPKTQVFLTSIKRNAISNPDSQSTMSLLSNFPEVKKINDLEKSILSDPLLGILNETFSLKNGSDLSQNLLLFKRICSFSQMDNIENIIDISQRKKSNIFRKKKKKIRKKSYSHSGKIRKEASFKVCNLKKKQNKMVKKKFNNYRIFIKEKDLSYLKNRKKKKIVTQNINNSPYFLRKLKSSSKKLKKNKKKNRKVFFFSKSKKNLKKFHFRFLSKLEKYQNISDVSEKKICVIKKNDLFSQADLQQYKGFICQRKIKNKLKFLTNIKRKKRIRYYFKKKHIKKYNKDLKNWRNPRFKKLKNIYRFRKSFPFRNNSFWKVEKKFLASKTSVKKNYVQINIENNRKLNRKIFFIKPMKFYRNILCNEFIKSKKIFSENKRKSKHSRLIHLKEATKLNDTRALKRIGELYFKGNLVPRSFSEATKHFIRASKLGKTDCLFRLGNLFFEGKGVYRNRKMAFQLYSSAAKRGHRKSIFNCIYFLEKGIGIKKDQMRALNLIKKELYLRKKKKKISFKRSKRSRRPNNLKIFRRFIRNSNDTTLLKCLITSLFFGRSSFFSGMLIKKANCPIVALNYFDKCFFDGSFNSLFRLSETLAENHQFFLSNEIAKFFNGFTFLEKLNKSGGIEFEKKGEFFGFIFFSKDFLSKTANSIYCQPISLRKIIVKKNKICFNVYRFMLNHPELQIYLMFILTIPTIYGEYLEYLEEKKIKTNKEFLKSVLDNIEKFKKKINREIINMLQEKRNLIKIYFNRIKRIFFLPARIKFFFQEKKKKMIRKVFNLLIDIVIKTLPKKSFRKTRLLTHEKS